MLALFLLPLLAGVLLIGSFGSDRNDDDDGGDNGGEPPVRLTEDEDSFQGTSGDDRVFGLGGDDDLSGMRGDDMLDGGADQDFLRGLGGDDTLFGGAGDDVLAGGFGNDHLFMGDGNDAVAAHAPGTQTEGDDLVRGGGGHDRITDTLGANTLYGDLGDDLLIGVDRQGHGGPTLPRAELIAADTLHGGHGDDGLVGDEGDQMTGGGGRDLFDIEVWRDDAAAVRITDLADDEVLILDDSRAGDHGAATTRLADNGEDLEVVIDGHVVAVLEGRTSIEDWQLQSSEDMRFGFGRLFQLGTAGDDSLHGVHAYTTGNQIHGLAGDDSLMGETLGDSLFGGDGNDRLAGVNGDDLLDGGAGDDVLVGGYGVDHFLGGAGNDLLEGRDLGVALAESLHGGDGDDRLLGDGGDSLWGDDGADTFARDFHAGSHAKGGIVSVADFDPASDRLEVDLGHGVTNIGVTFRADGDATLVVVDGEVMFRLVGVAPDALSAEMVTLVRGNTGADETLTGSEGDDTLNGWAGDDSILGLDGDDSILGGDGDDRVHAGIGHDTVALGDGNDSYVEDWENDDGGPPDNDLVHGGNGDDTIIASAGRDVLYGDLGDDTLSAVRHESGAELDFGADTLFGGFGRDHLIGNNGDTLVGGEGVDSFEVRNDHAGDLVIIDDLQPGEQIRILWNGAVGTELPTFVIAPNGEDTIISNSVIVRGRIDFANFDVVIGPLNP